MAETLLQVYKRWKDRFLLWDKNTFGRQPVSQSRKNWTGSLKFQGYVQTSKVDKVLLQKTL